MKNTVNKLRLGALALVLTAGVALIAGNQADSTAVGSDFLVRGNTVVNEATQPAAGNQTVELQDWEYTLRNRPVHCRFAR